MTAASESPHAEESAPPESSTAGERDAQAREIALQEESDARRALTEATPGFKARRRECVPGDGDCMFTAVAAAAGLTNAHLLRLAAVAFLRCNPTRVLPNTLELTLEDWTTAVNGITFHETLRGFESNSEPGAYMLATLATVVGRPITVVKLGWEEATYLPEGASLHMVWNPAEVNPDHLALLYTGTHYDALVLDGAPAVQATLTLASIVGYLPKDNVERVVGVYSLRGDDPNPVTLKVRLCCFNTALQLSCDSLKRIFDGMFRSFRGPKRIFNGMFRSFNGSKRILYRMFRVLIGLVYFLIALRCRFLIGCQLPATALYQRTPPCTPSPTCSPSSQTLT